MWTKESMQALLSRSDAAVERAIVVLFGRQTSDEKVTWEAKHHNARGYDAFRAPTLSKYATWIEGGKRPYGQNLMSSLHKAKARRFIVRYWRQLIEVAELKEKAEKKYLADERAAIQNS
jgi:hypothetical protein